MRKDPFEIICAIIVAAIFAYPIMMFLYVTFCILTDDFDALIRF